MFWLRNKIFFFITHFYLDAQCRLTVNALGRQKQYAITGFSCVKYQLVKSYGLAHFFLQENEYHPLPNIM